MIDIIIINPNNNLPQTLASLLLQKKIKLGTIYIWSNDGKINEIVYLFSKKMKICLKKALNIDETTILIKYSKFKEKGDYVFVIRSGDVIYNSFSLYTLYKELNNNNFDIANGNIIKGTKSAYFYKTNKQAGIFGRLYNNKFINKLSENNTFYKVNELILSKNPKALFLNDDIYVYYV